MNKTELAQLEGLANFLKYQHTWAFNQFVHLPHKIIGLFTGNRAMKTSGCAYQYVLRILSRHPIPEKNVLYFECSQGHKFNSITLPKDWICPKCKSEINVHERDSRILRFAAETLPGEMEKVDEHGGSAEVTNTVYPEFCKWLPPAFIKKDLKHRSMAMILVDPNNGRVFCDKQYKGQDIIVEFVSYKQSVQTVSGQRRISCWMDEEPPYDFYEEQIGRLIDEDGDALLSLTPANRLSWSYDEIFDRAQIYVRTQAVCTFLKTPHYNPKQIEFTDSPYPIAVVQAATDDNPTLNKQVIEESMGIYDDPDVVATRRYGIHRQVAGRIFKGFDYKVHFIDKDKYFPDNVPHEWVHGRAIDYHPQTPWACVCVGLSPTNEAFIWLNLEISPEKYTTREICREFALMGEDYKFLLNLIDPESETIRKDNISVLDDINREFLALKKNGVGIGGYWHTWDTKGEKGRDAIRERLKNSVTVGKPFNNETIEQGMRRYLPTLWILNNCKHVAKSMKMWSWEQYSDMKMKIRKGTTTDKYQQKWSHFNMSLESLFKHVAFKPRRMGSMPRQDREARYFQGRG